MLPANEAQLIERAKALVPTLAARAEACEQAGQLPEETVQDFVAAGFYDIAKPTDYGGYGYSPEVLFNVAMELARGRPSSAWCLCLIGVHNWEPGLMHRRAAQDLWGEDSSARYSSSYAPFGTVTQASGGYRLSGQWEWSSGSQHCTWVMLGGLLHTDGGAPEQIAMSTLR